MKASASKSQVEVQFFEQDLRVSRILIAYKKIYPKNKIVQSNKSQKTKKILCLYTNHSKNTIKNCKNKLYKATRIIFAYN